jgi:DDE superfamily endonuclease/Helix-turn-helix of DDE superfamily endonuclease
VILACRSRNDRAARNDQDVSSGWARAALSHRICTGLPRRQLGKLIAELAGPWMAQQESRLRDRRGHQRQRAAGAGPGHDLVFTDRVIATLVVLRFQLQHAALGVFYGVDRSTITRAVQEIRPLLAARGFAVPGPSGVRLRTLADVFAYAAAEGVTLRIDGTEVQVRRPRAGRPGRRAFISGKRRQNTKKATVITDGNGATLRAGAFRPGRQHDQTALKTAGIGDLLQRYPQVRALVDAGYRGLARQFPDQVTAPPLKPAKDAPPDEAAAGRPAEKTSPPSEYASSTPTPSTNSGRPCSAPPAAANTTTRPTRRSRALSPTGQPAADHRLATPPGQHGPTSIAHQVVSAR